MKKNLPRLLIIVLFFAGTYLIAHPFRTTVSLYSGLFLFLDFLVILSAAYFNNRTALLFAAAGSITALLRGAFLCLLLFAATALLLYLYSLKFLRLNRKIYREVDSLEEEKNILSVELRHTRLEHIAFRGKLHRYIALKWLTEILSSTLSWEKIISVIASETIKIINKPCTCLLYLLDKDKQEINLVKAEAIDPRYQEGLKKGDLFDLWVFKQRVPLLVTDTQKDFRFTLQDQAQESRGERSLIAAPLIRESRLLGILRLDDLKPKTYDVDDLRLLKIISDLAAVSVENALLYQQTQKLAITDGLTSLFLRRHFQERFDQEISRCLWTNSHLALLMFDIDNFKNYNDKYGHIAGDVILKQIAHLSVTCLNPGDIAVRYGGEEFAVLLINTTVQGARKIAEQIREKIEKKEFILRREVSKVTISGGISFFPEDAKVREALIQKADQALYQAKAMGKNRICIC